MAMNVARALPLAVVLGLVSPLALGGLHLPVYAQEWDGQEEGAEAAPAAEATPAPDFSTLNVGEPNSNLDMKGTFRK